MDEEFAGIDWPAEEHALCVVDGGGMRVRERLIDHSEAGIAALCRELVKRGVVRVAIERPDGILVDRLLEAGITVIAVHPNQAKAARDRYSVARGKSDRFDAFVLAEPARTDSHRLRAIAPDSDATKALRVLTRSREDLVEARVELAPSPADAEGLGPGRLGAWLARQGYSGSKSPEELLGRMRSAPVGLAGEAEARARRAAVLGLVAALEPIVAQIRELTSQIRAALAAHPDAEIFKPLFRDRKTVVCPATLIAELGDSRERYPTEAALAADAGMSPVAVESGKRRVASFRRACDKRLRDSWSTLADSTRKWHPWARRVCADAIARGQDHAHALRTSGRAWVRVLWRCRQDGVPYDPALHGNLRRLETAGG